MNKLSQIFMYEGKQVRMELIQGEPHWVAKDVCDILDINISQTRRLDDDEKVLRLTQTPSGDQEMLFVNEAGLYSLILGSKKPEAKPFKRWVTHEVLPAIRKTGTYGVQQIPQNFAEALRLAADISEQKQALEQKIERDRPMMLFAESLQVSQDSILVGELAKLLKQNGIEIGGTRLFNLLREQGYLIKKHGEQYNMPTQRSMELGIMEVKTGSRNGSDGTIRITRTPKITGKGQIYFINKFKSLQQAN